MDEVYTLLEEHGYDPENFDWTELDLTTMDGADAAEDDAEDCDDWADDAFACSHIEKSREENILGLDREEMEDFRMAADQDDALRELFLEADLWEQSDLDDDGSDSDSDSDFDNDFDGSDWDD